MATKHTIAYEVRAIDELGGPIENALIAGVESQHEAIQLAEWWMGGSFRWFEGTKIVVERVISTIDANNTSNITVRQMVWNRTK